MPLTMRILGVFGVPGRGGWSCPYLISLEQPLPHVCKDRQMDRHLLNGFFFSRDKLGEVISFTGATFPDTDSFLRSLKTQALTQLFIQAAGYSCTAHRLKILFVVKKLGTVAG